MATSFDKRRLLEVLKAIKDGWVPTNNYFVVYQLPEDVADQARVEAALSAASEEIRREAARPTWEGPANLLLREHPVARQVLLDPARRREHTQAVRQRREPFIAGLTDRLSQAPYVPARMVTTLVSESRGDLVDHDVVEALAQLGVSVREPVGLDVAGPPPAWQDIRDKLAVAGQHDLNAFLAALPDGAPGAAARGGANPYRDRLGARLNEISGRSDATTGRERSLITALGKLTGEELTALRRHALLERLRAATAYRYPQLVEVATQAAGQARELGIAASVEDVAYALWCEARHPTSDAVRWQRDVRQARAAKDLAGAIAALRSAGTRLTSVQKRELQELTRLVANLEGELEHAFALERTDREAAARVYLAVAAQWADPRPRAGLSRCPPESPRHVTARVQDQGVLLTWRPSPARSGTITYDVVRALDHAPAAVTDGVRLTTGDLPLSVVDPSPPGARQLHYAVFATRAGATSSPAVADPVVILGEITGLELEPGVDLIRGRFRLPPGATGAEVTRVALEARPARPVAVRDVRSDGFADADVEPQQRYEYRVRVRYRLADGRTVLTDGIRGEAGCQELPQPVIDLRVAAVGDELELSWTPPPRGTVEILEVPATSVPPSTVSPWQAVRQLGHALDGVSMRSCEGLRARAGGGAGELTLLPVTVLGTLAAVGRGQTVSRHLQRVSELRAVRRGRVVELRWAWPAGVNEVCVVYRTDAPPTGPQDPTAGREHLTRAVYETYGARLILPPGRHHFGVCAVSRADGRVGYGPLARVSESARSEIPYWICTGRLRARRHTLTVGSPSGPPLPAMELRAKSRTRPLSSVDGVSITELTGGVPRLVLPFEVPTQLSGPVHVRLFSMDPDVVLVDRSR